MDHCSGDTRSHAASRAIRAGCDDGQSIAFVSGNFNVVHPGHLRLLKFAAEQADVLVVGVHPDGSPGVTLSQKTPLDRPVDRAGHPRGPVRKRFLGKLMVIGDLIVDEYVTCDPVGMSQEGPSAGWPAF